MARNRAREGFVRVEGGRVWYRIAGAAGRTPLLTVHGGPGAPHDYLEPLEALGAERPVVFYDQLGCGKSDRPANKALWKTGRFVRELAQVRRALGLSRVHLLGQSWGTMLAVDYTLTRPAGVESLILADPALSIPRWTRDAARYRRKLPSAMQATLARHEKAGDTACLEYQGAALAFYKRHVCRLDPWPEPLHRTLRAFGTEVYNTMWGPNEFVASGSLKNYDRTSRLREISVPTLLLCGRYDEATPESTAFDARRIRGAAMVVFEKSAHMPHLEETAKYMRVVRDFLNHVRRA
jgi:proline iminopeptidase